MKIREMWEDRQKRKAAEMEEEDRRHTEECILWMAGRVKEGAENLIANIRVIKGDPETGGGEWRYLLSAIYEDGRLHFTVRRMKPSLLYLQQRSADIELEGTNGTGGTDRTSEPEKREFKITFEKQSFDIPDLAKTAIVDFQRRFEAEMQK